jgi:hypothetical protein
LYGDGEKIADFIVPENRRIVKKLKGEAAKNGDGGAAQQVPDSLEQVRDLLNFLPYFFRRAAAAPFPEE